MSYHNMIIRCDICGRKDFCPIHPAAEGRPLIGWERVYSYNEKGLPEHTCCPECEAKGRAIIRRAEQGN